MGSTGEQVSKITESSMSALTTVEMAHELYGFGAAGSLESFYTKFGERKTKLVQLIDNVWGREKVWEETGSVIKQRLEASASVVSGVMASFKEFQSLTVASGDDVSRKISDLERIMSTDRMISPTSSSLGSGVRLALGTPNFNINVIQRFEITDAISELKRVYGSLTSQASSVLDAVDRETLDAAGELERYVQDGQSARQSLASMRSKLDRIKGLVSDMNSVSAHISDKSFQKYIESFAKDSSDKVVKSMKAAFRTPFKLSEVKETAALDFLYQPKTGPALDTVLSKALNDVMEQIRRATKPMFQKKGDVAKRLNADLTTLKSSLDMVRPDNHSSPNFITNRGPRFVWTDARARLDAFAHSYGEGSHDASSGVDKSIEEQGVMYRKPDVARMRYYTEIAKRFKRDITRGKPGSGDGDLVEKLHASKNTLIERATAGIKDAVKYSKELPENDPAYAYHQRQRLARKKQAVIENYLREVKRLVARYMQIHTDFAIKANRQGMRYMTYWAAIDVASEEVQAAIKEYEALFAGEQQTIVSLGTDTVNEFRNECLVTFFSGELAKEVLQDMDMEQVNRINEKFNGLDSWCVENALQKIQTIHAGPPTIFDVITDGQIIMLYALKLVRFGFVVLALSLARRSFQTSYNERVYNRNSAPPHPAMMIAIFMALELSFAVLMLVVLYFLKYLFYHGPGTFFIDKYVLSRWLLDYVASTLVISIMAFIASDVIRKRKYFRYRYEGERGIRSLETIVRWTSLVVLMLPFYRMAD